MPEFALSLIAQATAAAETAAKPTANYGTLVALMIFIAASVWLGTLAQRVVKKSSFVKGFFIGNRGLGAWAVALTATVQSGGTFMGFPSLVYSHGWIVALWIGSYMVVPITGFGLIGKRIAHISRHTGAITMPDLFRERFGSPILGLVTSLLIILFMSSMMIAQFKAGATVMQLAAPSGNFLSLSEDAKVQNQQLYWIGLAVFSITVIGYTLIGGFLAAVWTDLFQSVMMFIGVIALLLLSLRAMGGLETATREAIPAAQKSVVLYEEADEREETIEEKEKREREGKPERKKKTKRLPSDVRPDEGEKYAHGPGFALDGRSFLPLSLAMSFFFFWPATGFASPASVTRIMACKDTKTLRRSIVLLCAYNLGIYLPLICICICARSLIPNLDVTGESDQVIPRMALKLTDDLPGGQLLAGIILAAPFGAIMATVSSYLVVIASGLVRDIYQRFINPSASDHDLKSLARYGMVVVGIVAVVLNIYPVTYLQALVVFSSGGAGASFIVPCLMLCYWRRATAAGVLAAMLSGAGTMLTVYLIGFFLPDPMIGQATTFRPYFIAGCEPLVFGVTTSAIVGLIVTYCTSPPDEKLVSPLFDAPVAADLQVCPAGSSTIASPN